MAAPRRVRTTDSRHNLPIAPNLIARDFTAAAPNRLWLADITYIPIAEGWLYLAAVMDLFSRKIVGWAMRAFVGRGLALPRLDRHGGLRWQPATVSAVTAILKNPAYAGAFVYGRTWQKPCNPQKSPRRGTDWRIVVREKYPAYIDCETFEKIQTMLRDNHAEYQHIKSRGIPRDGAALLHGITYCGGLQSERPAAR